jgi:hypothetical protein
VLPERRAVEAFCLVCLAMQFLPGRNVYPAEHGNRRGAKRQAASLWSIRLIAPRFLQLPVHLSRRQAVPRAQFSDGVAAVSRNLGQFTKFKQEGGILR